MRVNHIHWERHRRRHWRHVDESRTNARHGTYCNIHCRNIDSGNNDNGCNNATLIHRSLLPLSLLPYDHDGLDDDDDTTSINGTNDVASITVSQLHSRVYLEAKATSKQQ
jgi:hypothetical protein